MDKIFSVTELTESLRRAITSSFPFVWVKGEVTNCSRSPSGHIYFSLKDAQAQLQCVWFAGRQKQAQRNFDPLTGEVYSEPRRSPAELAQNGATLLCAGSLDIYGPRGAYQLIVELVQEGGAGQLALEFEQRKARLAALGYFSSERKRPLPFAPLRLALITSLHGAAIHDFLELASQRGVSSRVRLFPVPVQGQGAAEKIAAAIVCANAQNWAEAIVLVRGGGSLEDLWAFNEECLAKAIFESRLPVLAGIGHEVDFSLADLTADVRAATPSHAAQLLWPLRNELWQSLDNLAMNLEKAIHLRLASLARDQRQLAEKLSWLAPLQQISRHQEKLDQLTRQLLRELDLALDDRQRKFALLADRFKSLAALGKVQQSLEEKLNDLGQKLLAACELKLDLATNRLKLLEISLNAVNPLLPLKRGYALLTAGERVVSSVAAVSKGQQIRATLEDGSLELEIKAKVMLE